MCSSTVVFKVLLLRSISYDAENFFMINITLFYDQYYNISICVYEM